MRNVAMACVCLPIVFLNSVGCSQSTKTHEVEGVVLLGGQPLDRIEVIFIPDEIEGNKGPRSTAITDENGHYRLMTEDGKDPGAVAGKHRIIFNDLKAILPAQLRQAIMARPTKGNPGLERPEGAPPAKGQKGMPGQGQAGAPQADSKVVPSRIPPPYREFTTTPMKTDVQQGKQTIDLELTGR
jgi:hypothetical protein